MSLDTRPLYLNSFLKQSLNIEYFEYSYFIPILAQTAEYWGDAEVVSICNIMSRQVKEYFHHTAFVFFYMYTKDQKMKENLYFTKIDQNDLNRMKKSEDFYARELQILSSYHSFKITDEIQLENVSSLCANTKAINLNTLQTLLDEMENTLLSNLPVLQKYLNNINKNEDISLNVYKSDLKCLSENYYSVLLKNLRYRKFFKATTWYPVLSQIASAQGLVNLSQNFLQMAQSEKTTSLLLNQVIQKQILF
jgi:hypothetical protein